MTAEVLIFSVNGGALYDARGRLGTAYAGARGFRTTADERKTAVGPLPRGRWKLGAPRHDAHMGPLTIPLIPLPGTKTFDRSGFYIHGDDVEGDASTGCIITNRGVRANLATALAAGREFVLYVIGDLGDLTP